MHGTRISARFLCLDGRVSGQSCGQLRACHSDPCLHLRGIDLGLFPAGSAGEAEKTGLHPVGGGSLENERVLCGSPVLPNRRWARVSWPLACSMCPHPALPQVQITPSRVPLGPLNVVRRRGEEVRKEHGAEPVGEACRLVHTHTCVHTYTHSSHQLRSRGASESQSTAGPQRAEGCSGRAVMWVEGWK